MKQTVEVPEGHFLAWVAIPYSSLSVDAEYPEFYQLDWGSYKGQCVGSKGVRPCIVKKSKDKKGNVASRIMIPTSNEMPAKALAEKVAQDLGF